MFPHHPLPNYCKRERKREKKATEHRYYVNLSTISAKTSEKKISSSTHIFFFLSFCLNLPVCILVPSGSLKLSPIRAFTRTSTNYVLIGKATILFLTPTDNIYTSTQDPFSSILNTL